MVFPGGSDGKESTCTAGDLSSIPGLGRSPGGGRDNPTTVFLPGESHGQKSLVVYSPWDYKWSDMAERPLKKMACRKFQKEDSQWGRGCVSRTWSF